jgi:hypothetical protein
MDDLAHVHVTSFGVVRCESCGRWHVFREHDDQFELLDRPFDERDAAVAYARLMSAAFRMSLDINEVPWVVEPDG